jgi:hypothetical protein
VGRLRGLVDKFTSWDFFLQLLFIIVLLLVGIAAAIFG